MVPRPACAQPARRALSDLDVRDGARADGPHRESCSARGAAWGRSPSASATCSASPTSRAPADAPLDIDAIATAILADLGDRTCASFRVSARRADKRFPLTSPQIEREVGGRIKEAQRLDRRSRRTRSSTIHVELLTERGVLLLRQGARARRPADRDGRPRGVPAVGRHRFAGGRAPHDEARLHA